MSEIELKKCISTRCLTTDSAKIEATTTGWRWDGNTEIKKYQVVCDCGTSGSWKSSLEVAAAAWNETASICSSAERAAMEADCKAICEYCEDGGPLIHEPKNAIHKWMHKFEGMRPCRGELIREAFRANEAEEVEGGD